MLQSILNVDSEGFELGFRRAIDAHRGDPRIALVPAAFATLARRRGLEPVPTDPLAPSL